MVDPVFWLGLSILLVAVSLTAVLCAALPALRELSRAARSAEKLFDTLNRELPPTLESIRLTGMEITNLTDDMSQGVQSAGRVAQQIDQSIAGVKQQTKQAQSTTRSIVAGVKAAWRAFNRPSTPPRRPRNSVSGEPVDRLSPSAQPALEFENTYASGNASSSREADTPEEARLDETLQITEERFSDRSAPYLEPNPRENAAKRKAL